MNRMTALSRDLQQLTEEKGTAPKYVDRDLIDYWRTVQGTPVGFHGKVPGEGVPIAGPPVLTGGSGSGNPLLDPLLKKYPAGTYTGDAIRKPNFPLSLCVFFDKVLGNDDAIMKRMGELGKFYKTNGKGTYRGANALDKLFAQDPEKQVAYGMLKQNFSTLTGSMSTICSIMNSLGISGTLKPSDGAAGKTPEQIDLFLKNRGTNRKAVEDMLRDVYLMNQYIVRQSNKTGVEVVTRGFGQTIPGLDSEKSVAFIKAAKQSGVPIRIAGVRACAPTASGDTTGFGPIGFQSIPVPIEAFLSSFQGARIQGSQFDNERESMTLGLADLAIDPKHLTLNVSVAGSAEKENKAINSAPASSPAPPISASVAKAQVPGKPAASDEEQGILNALGPELASVIPKDAIGIMTEAYKNFGTAFTYDEMKGTKTFNDGLAQMPLIIAGLNSMKVANKGGKPGAWKDLSPEFYIRFAMLNALNMQTMKASGASEQEIKAATEYLNSGNFSKKPPVNQPILNRLHENAQDWPVGEGLSDKGRAAMMAADIIDQWPNSYTPSELEELQDVLKKVYEKNPFLKGVRILDIGMEDGSLNDEFFFPGEKDIRKLNPDSESDINYIVGESMERLAKSGNHLFLSSSDIAAALALGEKLGVQPKEAIRQYRNAVDIMLTLKDENVFSSAIKTGGAPVSIAVYKSVLGNEKTCKERVAALEKRVATMKKKLGIND